MDQSYSSDEIDQSTGSARMHTNSADGTCDYRAREAVGVFTSPDALEAAVDELEISGFDRATLSVLATDETIKDRVGHLYRTAAEIEDDRMVPQAAFASTDSRVEGEAAAVGIPLYVGGCVGAGIAAVGFGGALAATLAATVAGGAAGLGLGAILAGAISHRHRVHVEEQLAQGGMVLWVSVRDDTAERRALDIMKNTGARDVHIHELEREWTLKDRPLAEAQFDPFLWWPSKGARA